jgi:hypothetical protein
LKKSDNFNQKAQRSLILFPTVNLYIVRKPREKLKIFGSKLRNFELDEKPFNQGILFLQEEFKDAL